MGWIPLLLVAVLQTRDGTSQEPTLAVRWLDQARLEREAGDLDRARFHLLESWRIGPGPLPLALLAQLAATASNEDEQFLFEHLLEAYAVGEDGKVPRAVPGFAGSRPRCAVRGCGRPEGKLARSAFLLLKAVERDRKGFTPATSQWLFELTETLALRSPALLERCRQVRYRRIRGWRPNLRRSFQGLQDLVREAREAGDLGLAVEASRLLAAWEHHDVAFERVWATGRWSLSSGWRGLVGELRSAWFAAHPDTELSGADLAGFDREQRLRADWAHRRARMPAWASSPQGWYHLESLSGVDALRLATENVERIHRGIAAWEREDPFVAGEGIAAGTVRLWPRWLDLEAEGQPAWWADGFATSKSVHLRVNFASQEDMLRVLAHELTHRFDQRLHSGMPDWMAEGRATQVGVSIDPWTGAIRERVLDHDRAYRGLRAGRALWEWSAFADYLDGEVEDGRFHYTLGYALWMYLSEWPGRDGQPRYRQGLLRFLASCPDESDAEAFRERIVRTEDPEVFLNGFRQFLFACLFAFRPEDLQREYPEQAPGFAVFSTPPSGSSTSVRGILCRNPERTRYLPHFGEGVAAASGLLLMEQRRFEAAIPFLEAATTVDEFREEIWIALEMAYRNKGRADLADAVALGCRALQGDAPSWLRPSTWSPPRRAAASPAAFALAVSMANKAHAALAESQRCHEERSDQATSAHLRAYLGPGGADPSAEADEPAGLCGLSLDPAGLVWTEDQLFGDPLLEFDGAFWQVRDGLLDLGVDSRLVPDTPHGPTAGGLVREIFLRTRLPLHDDYSVRGFLNPRGRYGSMGIVVGWNRQGRFEMATLNWASRAPVMKLQEDGSRAQEGEFTRVTYQRGGHRDGELSRSRALVHESTGGKDKHVEHAPGIPFLIRVRGDLVEVEVDGDLVDRWRPMAGRQVRGHFGFVLRSGELSLSRLSLVRHARGGGLHLDPLHGGGLSRCAKGLAGTLSLMDQPLRLEPAAVLREALAPVDSEPLPESLPPTPQDGTWLLLGSPSSAFSPANVRRVEIALSRAFALGSVLRIRTRPDWAEADRGRLLAHLRSTLEDLGDDAGALVAWGTWSAVVANEDGGCFAKAVQAFAEREIPLWLHTGSLGEILEVVSAPIR